MTSKIRYVAFRTPESTVAAIIIKREKIWNDQNSSWSMLPGQTEQSGEMSLGKRFDQSLSVTLADPQKRCCGDGRKEQQSLNYISNLVN